MFWKYYFSIKYIQIVYADEALACKIKIKAIGQIFEFMFFLAKIENQAQYWL